MKIPSHYKLVDEHPHSYEIHDSRDGRNFHIAKHGLDLKTHGNLSKISRFSKGGKVKSLDDDHIDLDHVTPSGDIIKDEEQDDSKPFTMSGISPAIDPMSSQVQNIDSNLIPSSQQPLIPESEQPLTDIPVKDTSIAQPVPAPEDQPKKVPYDPFNYSKLNESIDREKSAIEAGATAEQTKANKTNEAYEEASDKIEDMTDPLRIYQDNKIKNQQLFNSFYTNKIDPNHYMKNMSTGNRVLAAIGLILGGAGAGQHGQNPALKIIQDAIDRDIDAQKNNQSNRYNLWKMNLEATHSEMEATLRAQTQLYTVAQVKALQYAAEAGGPMAQARAAPLVAELEKEKHINLQKQSLLQAGRSNQMIGTDPEVYVSLLVPKDRQADAIKEINQAKKLKGLKDGILQSIEDLKKLPLGGLFSPNERDSAKKIYMGTLAKELEGTFTQVQTESLMDSIFGGAFTWDTTREKMGLRLDQIFKSKLEDSAFRTGTMGIGLDRFAATSFEKSKAGKKMDTDRNYIIQKSNNSNPEIQKNIEYLKKKHGL